MTQTDLVSMSYINIDMSVPQAPPVPPLNICTGRPASLEPTGGALPAGPHTAEAGFTSTPSMGKEAQSSGSSARSQSWKGESYPGGGGHVPTSLRGLPSTPGGGGTGGGSRARPVTLLQQDAGGPPLPQVRAKRGLSPHRTIPLRPEPPGRGAREASPPPSKSEARRSTARPSTRDHTGLAGWAGPPGRE